MNWKEAVCTAVVVVILLAIAGAVREAIGREQKSRNAAEISRGYETVLQEIQALRRTNGAGA